MSTSRLTLLGPRVGLKKKVANELVLASPAMSCMSCSSYSNDLQDGRWVAVQPLLCVGRCFQDLFKTTHIIRVVSILLFLLGFCFCSYSASI